MRCGEPDEIVWIINVPQPIRIGPETEASTRLMKIDCSASFGDQFIHTLPTVADEA
jgi:hypothetical protein